MGYQLIEDYGVIGNLETCPLVGRDGSIDWCCFPHIESSSAFAALLDHETGGRFAIQPHGDFESHQEYIERTNVLQTRFETPDAAATLTDFMPVMERVAPSHTSHSIFRRVECSTGPIEIEVAFSPRFDYARAKTTVEHTAGGVVARGNGEQLFLSAPKRAEFDIEGDDATATISLDTDETAWFVLQYNDRDPVEPAACESFLERVIEFWQDWAHDCDDESECRFGGTYHDAAVRSGLVLRLLMNPQTHAIAAAPTTSLPEAVGGSRNWDYRFSWIRDTAFTIQALYELGHEREATNGYDWCLTMCHKEDPEEINHPLYGLHFRTRMRETRLEHLSGYRDSKPVRIGNAAGDQEQLDIYGELVLAVYAATNYGEDIHAGTWSVLREIIDYVCDSWRGPDSGIWEVRSQPAHIVHSKVLCWAAIDRAIDIASRGNFDAPIADWKDERREIKQLVLDRGFNDEIGSFTQTFDGDRIDAAALRIGGVGFLPFEDERIQGTIDAVMECLLTEDGLVYRYEGDDGLDGEEGAFVLCSFWLIDCLALSGRTAEAREIFEGVMGYVSPLGLFAEEIDPETGEHRGNFPQAFSHVGLINATLYLAHAEAESEGAVSDTIGMEPAEEIIDGSATSR